MIRDHVRSRLRWLAVATAACMAVAASGGPAAIGAAAPVPFKASFSETYQPVACAFVLSITGSGKASHAGKLTETGSGTSTPPTSRHRSPRARR